MASSARAFNQTFRFGRNFKLRSSKVQKLTSCLHVTNNSRKLSQISRPLASVCGALNGQPQFNFKTKMQFALPLEKCSILTRCSGFLSPAVQASEDCSATSTEGTDSSCEAMEGPHGDDDGLVIHYISPQEDL